MVESVQNLQHRAERHPVGVRAKALFKKVMADDVPGLAAEIAYYWVFALPPLMVLVVLTGAWLDRFADVNVVGQLRQQVNERAPADAASVINRVIDGAVAEVGGGAASVGVLVAATIALWSGSNGVGALMKAFNRAYDIEEARPFVRKRLVAIGLTLLLVAILNGAFLLLVYGQRIGTWLADRIGAGTVFDVIWGLGRVPFALVAIVAMLAVLYRIGPNAEIAMKAVIKGAVLATVLWIIASLGFGVYLRFSDPGSAYGVLGSVIVLMFFFYLTALIFLVGAEVNSMLAKEKEGDADYLR
ncbi:YihY/virulence factor BrkB family protein [soil metagenome]